jgi:preprotein translocase subunit SecF
MFLRKVSFKFVKFRTIYFIAALTVAIIASVCFLKSGLNYGADFKGGFVFDITLKNSSQSLSENSAVVVIDTDKKNDQDYDSKTVVPGSLVEEAPDSNQSIKRSTSMNKRVAMHDNVENANFKKKTAKGRDKQSDNTDKNDSESVTKNEQQELYTAKVAKMQKAEARQIDVSVIRKIFEELDLVDCSLQSTNDNHVFFRMPYNTEKAVIDSVRQKIIEEYPHVEFARFESIGPKVSEEMIYNGIFAVILAMLAIFAYIWFRFRWQFGLCAIIALLHDCFVVFALYSVFRFEFSESAIVAFLITVSYSINDTVVIFDRVKTNLRKYRNMDIAELLDLSLNTTFTRTILTSFSTLLALAVLYFFGGRVIQSFSLPIIIGVIAGTYSSICIATPLLMLFDVRSADMEAAKLEADLIEKEKKKN